MTDTFELRDLYESLEYDEFRHTQAFSEPLSIAQTAIHHPYATNGDRAKALSLWLQKAQNQPCIFGRVAASQRTMEYCFLTEADIYRSDQHVAKRISEAVLGWKRRSIYPVVSRPAHGFMLVAASKRLSHARPDVALMRFARKLVELWGCPSENTEHGRVYLASLYLRHPKEERVVKKFTFSVDFFAAQGDGRWWQDHRVPGGIAFTANSVGHMRWYAEWYKGERDQTSWTVKTAMGTIESAAKTEHGRGTWLLPLSDGKPYANLACPIAHDAPMKDTLRDKDWTKYGGHLHTDHSLRSEFFSPRPDKSEELKDRGVFLQDFTYLYDPKSADHVRFTQGAEVSWEEVVAEIGDPADYTLIAGDEPRLAAGGAEPDQRTTNPEVAALLDKCSAWAMSGDEVGALLE